MKILLAYDGSEEAGHALARTAKIAARGKGSGEPDEVTVVSVVPLQASGPRSGGAVMSGDVEEHGRELDEAVAKLKALGVEAQTIEAVGHPAESIVAEAERGAFDLIIVGHRGRHGVHRFSMGSTSSRVVSHAHCDVLVVR
jgi:nucleotide-binding universal stress UspA family protein